MQRHRIILGGDALRNQREPEDRQKETLKDRLKFSLSPEGEGRGEGEFSLRPSRLCGVIFVSLVFAFSSHTSIQDLNALPMPVSFMQISGVFRGFPRERIRVFLFCIRVYLCPSVVNPVSVSGSSLAR